MSKPIEAPMPPQDVAREQPPEPPPEAKPAEQAPLEEAPPEEYTYRMPTTGGGGGTIAVSAGSGPTGSLYGRRGGTGNNKNASSDVAPPRPSVARVKRPPEQIGDYSRASRELYTEEARRAQVEGQVVLLLSVDESGRVAAVKLVKGLGYGLDEKAMAFGKTIRFRPAIDTEDRPIPYQLRWTFTFYIDD
ncbi:MAG: TonB family protein [Deltaproteobacteria bacterium]|nr:TonB family protein [Deltaproteobacteria bacterium]